VCVHVTAELDQLIGELFDRRTDVHVTKLSRTAPRRDRQGPGPVGEGHGAVPRPAVADHREAPHRWSRSLKRVPGG
jgi:hypothetical protein